MIFQERIIADINLLSPFILGHMVLVFHVLTGFDNADDTISLFIETLQVERFGQSRSWFCLLGLHEYFILSLPFPI
jgi:hypothetical protein